MSPYKRQLEMIRKVRQSKAELEKLKVQNVVEWIESRKVLIQMMDMTLESAAHILMLKESGLLKEESNESRSEG